MSRYYQEQVEQYGSQRAAARALGIPVSTFRDRLAREQDTEESNVPEHGFVPTDEMLPATHVEEGGVDTEDRSNPDGVRRFILTSAQNNCDVHGPFLNNLKALASYLDADLMISFCIYDRTGYRGLVRKGDAGRKPQEVWWDKAVEPYVVNHRVRLHRRLAFCGELDILATAKNPLSGLESYCGRSSIIIPHNRFAMKCVPSRKGQMPKEMHTTGSVTKRKFIQRKTGQVAHFHHVLGALLVEISREGYWYVHHLNAEDDGTFYWLDKVVVAGEVEDSNEDWAGLILGDLHIAKSNNRQRSVARSIVRTYYPADVVIHDAIDFTARNHHNRHDPLFKIGMETCPVSRELEDAAEFLDSLSDTSDITVVRGNHDDALLRWIKEADWKQDPINAWFYLVAAHAAVERRRIRGEYEPNMLRWAIVDHIGVGGKTPRFLDHDESFEIAGIECGMHGHIGPNGSRGNPRAFAKLGFKTFTAHTHTPSIVDGCYTVGVLGNLDMDYNKGPSSWMHAHGIIYPNGKRAFLWIKGGKWQA